MQLTSVGDLSRSFSLKRETAELKAAVDRLSREVTTGRTQDVPKAVRGDFLPLSGIERTIRTYGAYQSSAGEAGVFVETAQRALDTVQEFVTRSGSSLMSVSSAGDASTFSTVTGEARQNLESVISALNVQVGGRTVFAGTATSGAALLDADAMMTDIAAAVVGLTTATDVVDAIDDWFEQPGGSFETIGYLGSTTALLPFQLAPGTTARFTATAADAQLRDVLKGLALGAVLDGNSLALTSEEQRELIRTAGEALLGADKDLALYRSGIGTAEAQIANAVARNSAEISALELVRADILGVDQYAAASDLESVAAQLETLYALTARTSGLSLVNFL
ncbi:MAG: flagellin [Pseudomonadota bacterium]